MNAFLKIKILSLGAESAIIRQQALKWAARAAKAKTEAARDKAIGTKLSLSHHRRSVVRPECRAANLAYAFLRGRPYVALERTCHEIPDFERVWKNIEKFGTDPAQVSKQRFAEWHEAAVHVLAAQGKHGTKHALSYTGPKWMRESPTPKPVAEPEPKKGLLATLIGA